MQLLTGFNCRSCQKSALAIQSCYIVYEIFVDCIVTCAFQTASSIMLRLFTVSHELSKQYLLYIFGFGEKFEQDLDSCDMKLRKLRNKNKDPMRMILASKRNDNKKFQLCYCQVNVQVLQTRSYRFAICHLFF